MEEEEGGDGGGEVPAELGAIREGIANAILGEGEIEIILLPHKDEFKIFD